MLTSQISKGNVRFEESFSIWFDVAFRKKGMVKLREVLDSLLSSPTLSKSEKSYVRNYVDMVVDRQLAQKGWIVKR